jgi:hypothetical protein
MDHGAFNKRLSWCTKQMHRLAALEKGAGWNKQSSLNELNEMLDIAATNLAPFILLRDKIKSSIKKIEELKY